MLEPSDAANVEIPMAVLASTDENAATVEEYEKVLKWPKHAYTWEGSVRGWMSARYVQFPFAAMSMLTVLSVPIYRTHNRRRSMREAIGSQSISLEVSVSR